MRTVEGHIRRALEGKTVEVITKDGFAMIIHCTNGERWAIMWANLGTGEGKPGEPCVFLVDDMRADKDIGLCARDGHVNRLLQGLTIEEAKTDGECLYLNLVGGRRVGIVWVDPTSAERVHAEPCLARVDVLARPIGVSALGEAGRPG